MTPRQPQTLQSGEATNCPDVITPGWLSPSVQAMFAGAFDALIVVDNTGRCVAVNPAACQLWDLPQAALCDRPITDFTNPSDDLGRLWPLPPQTETPQTETPQTETPQIETPQTETTLLRGEGCLYCSPTRTRQVAFTLAMNTWPDHHLLTLCVRAASPPENRPTALPNEDSEYRQPNSLETVLDAIPDPIFLKDAQGRWQLVNQAALDLFQLTGAEYQGHTDAELAESTQFYREMLLACIDSDEIAWGHHSLIRTEEAIPQPTGNVRTFDVYKVPLFHADGSRKGLVVVGRDISDRKQAEAALQVSEDRLRLTLELTGIGFWEWQPQTGFYTWSEQVTQLTEIPLGLENMYETWLSRVDPAMREAVDHTIQQSLVEQTSFAIDYRYQLQNGTWVWRQVAGRGLYTPAGELHTVLGVAIDIHDRKTTELSLRESELRFRTIFEQANIGIVVCDPPDFALTVTNPFFEEFIGYSAAALAHLDFAAITHPDDVVREQQLIDDCLAKQRDAYQIEKRYLRQDGEVRWGSLSASLQRDEDGQVLLGFAMVQDIHDRKLAEAALRERDEQLRAIFDNAMVGMALVDPDGYVVAANEADCRFLGYTPAELIGMHFSEFTYAEDLNIDQDLFKNLLNGGLTNYVIDKRYIRKDQTLVWGRLSVSLVRNADHSVRYTVVVCEDISDRKQAEENLRRYERIVAATPDGIALIDCDYRYQAVNQTYLDWHQKTIDQLIGHPVAEILGEERFIQVIKTYLDYALSGRVVRYQEWVTYPSIGQQFMGVTYAPYTDEAGTIAGVAVSRRILTELKQAEMALQQLAERELLLTTINNRMRQSLNLRSILQTVVTEVRAFLKTDRVLVYRLNASDNGTVVAESVAEGWLSLADFIIGDPCLSDPQLLNKLAQGQVQNLPDVSCSQLNPCYLEMLGQFQVQAHLALPLLQGERVWGLLIAHHCQSPRYWQYEDIDLLKQLSGQLAIAIQQSELYRQVQDLNSDLERQVTIRTAELQQAIQFEDLLKQITDKVRDSLDEQQILQTVVQALVQGMLVECCATGIYNEAHTTSTITHEFVRDLKSAQGTTIEMATAPHAEVYADLLQGKTCIFGDLAPNPLRSETRLFAILACPIVDDQNVLGDLWVFKHRGDIFNNQEIRLGQQVANQCAIALRQSRLYQAAQAQVTELERLNQLKDDFLSTVSHELRTPMSNIKMATQMLEIQLTRLGILGNAITEEVKAAQVNRYFNILQDECQRETTLINDLLDLTRIDANPDPLHFIPIELRPWVFLITEPFNHQMRSQQQTLEIAIPSTLTLETDITYLERILRELMNNACKYTPPGETIRISAQTIVQPSSRGIESTIETIVELRISNTGIEIPAAEYARVFERFYRIPNHDRWQYSGTGLGLALVKRFVERLGGTIQVESTTNLTDFVIRLPSRFPRP